MFSHVAKLILGIFLALALIHSLAKYSCGEEQLSIASPDFGFAHFSKETKNLVVLQSEDSPIVKTILPWGYYDECWWEIREQLEGKLVSFELGIGGRPSIVFVNSALSRFIRKTCTPNFFRISTRP